MKKILIMAMSCQNEFFVDQEKYVKETWAKDIIDGKYENISFMIYRGGYDKNSYSKKENLLKLNVEDGLEGTFKKTYFAFSMAEKIFGEYDYIFRTNTSTFVNVELLNVFIQQIENDELVYSGDIYSLTELNAPYPMCLSVRGNALILSKRNVELVLKDGLSFLYNEQSDDITISNIINSYHIKQGQDYKNYLRSFYHGWYKCINPEKDFDNGHKLSTFGNACQDYNYWKHFITIQIRNYGDLTNFIFRQGESEKFYELQKIFEGQHNEDINVSVKLNNDRGTNYEIFIGSILGYVTYDKWKATPKVQLYDYEINNKAADDIPGQTQTNKKFIYVDYYYNKGSNEQLI